MHPVTQKAAAAIAEIARGAIDSAEALQRDNDRLRSEVASLQREKAASTATDAKLRRSVAERLIELGIWGDGMEKLASSLERPQNNLEVIDFLLTNFASPAEPLGRRSKLAGAKTELTDAELDKLPWDEFSRRVCEPLTRSWS